MAGKVFICYRRDDSAGHAGRVHDRLQREFGDDLLFMDVDGIPLGANFVKVLGEEVAKCDALLAMIGPAWLDARDDTGKRRLDNPDDFVRIEIGTALERGVPVIPILFEGTRIPKAHQLPDKLRELALRNGLDVRHASFPQDMERLIRALKGIQSPQGLASTIPPLVHRDAPSRKVWTFLGDDKKRAVLGWIGGGVAAVVGALWAAFVYLAPPSKPGTPPASIEAGPGDVAIGDNVSGTKRLPPPVEPLISKPGAATARLEEAVAVYRETLTELTRERVPLDWAMTQNNLGDALLRLGERESGTARLEEAVAVYREALTELTRERVPLDWAMTQNNLGDALLRLGERESGTARLEEAVGAYREALKERTRERVPLDWAMTQNNLGNALLRLGERESGTARLEEAVGAYREALKERTRERSPLDWATTQTNLGRALTLLATRR